MNHKRAFRFIFWGYLLTFVSINFDWYDIVPETVGYLVIFAGLGYLAAAAAPFARGRALAAVLALLGFSGCINYGMTDGQWRAFRRELRARTANDLSLLLPEKAGDARLQETVYGPTETETSPANPPAREDRVEGRYSDGTAIIICCYPDRKAALAAYNAKNRHPWLSGSGGAGHSFHEQTLGNSAKPNIMTGDFNPETGLQPDTSSYEQWFRETQDKGVFSAAWLAEARAIHDKEIEQELRESRDIDEAARFIRLRWFSGWDFWSPSTWNWPGGMNGGRLLWLVVSKNQAGADAAAQAIATSSFTVGASKANSPLLPLQLLMDILLVMLFWRITTGIAELARASANADFAESARWRWGFLVAIIIASWLLTPLIIFIDAPELLSVLGTIMTVLLIAAVVLLLHLLWRAPKVLAVPSAMTDSAIRKG